MTDNLHTWLNEREAIREIRNVLVRVPDAYYNFPKLVRGVKAVLELHVKETGGTPDGSVADVCSCGLSYWPCSTVQKLQEAINDE